MPEPARHPEEQERSIAGRTPDGRFAQGNQAAVGQQRGPDKGPRRKIVYAILLQALAAEQRRQLAPGQKKVPVKAAGMLDAVEGVQMILRRKKVPKIFLETLELIREVIDDDSASGAQARQTFFILSGDYHDQRQMHLHQEGAEQAQGPAPEPGPPPVPREPLRDANGNIFEALEPFE